MSELPALFFLPALFIGICPHTGIELVLRIVLVLQIHGIYANVLECYHFVSGALLYAIDHIGIYSIMNFFESVQIHIFKIIRPEYSVIAREHIVVASYPDAVKHVSDQLVGILD